MTRRVLVGLGWVTLLLVASPGPGAPQEEVRPARVPPAAGDYDLTGIRDIFRYADETPASSAARTAGETPRAEPEENELAPPPRVRLAGLVERGGRLVAALVIDGEMVLLGEGQSALGFSVLEVAEDGVRLRTPEGDEQKLDLR